MAVPALLFAFFCSRVPAVAAGEALFLRIPWIDTLGIGLEFRLDGLSMLFALLITGIGVLVALYSIFYLHKSDRLRSFYVFLGLFMASMLGVVLSDNLLLLYVFWELTSLSSFFLIGFWFERDRSRYGAQRALLVTVAGGFALLIAFILIGQAAGTYSISGILDNISAVQASGAFPAMAVLVLAGALAKSAQIPFHIWLPTAMEAPTPISCYLHSATMVKAGIFLAMRLLPVFGASHIWQGALTLIGLASLLFGSYMALRQTDMKALLAYSTISQLGLIMSLLGIGTEAAVFAAAFHILNHSAFKGSLFLVTGIVDHERGTRDMRLLSGIGRAMPMTGAIAFISSLSMAGIPPFSGFLSKEMFLTAFSGEAGGAGLFSPGAAMLLTAVCVIGSLFTFVYSLTLFGKVFLGGKQARKGFGIQQPAMPLRPLVDKTPFGLILPTALLAAFNIAPAVLPGVFGRVLVAPAASAALAHEAEQHIAFWHGFNVPLLLTLAVFAGGGALYANVDAFKAFIRRRTMRFGIEYLYEKAVPGVYGAAGRLTDSYMRGSLRNYTAMTILAFIALASIPLTIYALWGRLSVSDLAPVNAAEAVMCACAAAAAICAARVEKPLYAVLALAGVGSMISLFFVVFRAPDLALTQLLVEICSTVLFLLALRKLPGGMAAKPPTPAGRKRINLIVAAAFGGLVGFLSFWGHSNISFRPISWFYSENSLPLAGGRNIVNVTLVDFRGLDTMGEITVLSIAAVGVLMLLNAGGAPRGQDAKGAIQTGQILSTTDPVPSAPSLSNNLIMRVMLRPLVLIILMTALFLFWAGHNAPGGGFIAGLMFSGAIILMYLARGSGFPAAASRRYKLLLPLGLSFAAGCGLIGVVAGEPFLTHYFGYFHLPFFGELELATATIFDFGVFLVVIGTVMSIVTNIAARQGD